MPTLFLGLFVLRLQNTYILLNLLEGLLKFFLFSRGGVFGKASLKGLYNIALSLDGKLQVCLILLW